MKAGQREQKQNCAPKEMANIFGDHGESVKFGGMDNKDERRLHILVEYDISVECSIENFFDEK